MVDEDLKHLCHLASVWAGNVLRDDYDPGDFSDEHPQNIKNCHQILAQAFVGLLKLHPELKPRFRMRGDAYHDRL